MVSMIQVTANHAEYYKAIERLRRVTTFTAFNVSKSGRGYSARC